MKNGFTLLELSIVLVIIGLIIGGITAGADLIRSAELNTVISDVNKYKVALNTFKLKYNQLPGDMDNASSYWPTECAAVHSTVSFCDGSGNGIIHGVSGGVEARESHNIWLHLVLSGIISGSYTGFENADGGTTAGENIPESKISGAGFNIHEEVFYGKTAMGIGFGVPAADEYKEYLPVLIAAEAQAIDSKADDGVASSGAVIATDDSYNGTANCISGSDYDLSQSVIGCDMFFWLK